ncbi:putative salicylate hydroxylase [Podospora australis]|uniref:Salicylate hydroxylase n=1 Tax=Podospora australis TaxID=1536484 RepID=A0AAN7AEV1_9PEZI|nr:putative salicylate hydroxylase [Podospora australis]
MSIGFFKSQLSHQTQAQYFGKSNHADENVTMPDQKQAPFELALIGAGITSLTLSLALTRLKIKHTIYEQSPQLAELGAGLGFGANAVRAFEFIDPRLLPLFKQVGSFAGAPSAKGRAILESYRQKDGIILGQDDNRRIKIGEEEGEGKVWIEFLDGTNTLPPEDLAPEFVVKATYGMGHGAVHRAKWLDVLAGLVEAPIVFGKRLQSISQPQEGGEGKVKMVFEDGTEAEADAVIGCDGVKSRVREAIDPAAKCGYSGKYAYRCLIPWADAVGVLGEDRASVSSLWMGQDRHVLTFPVGTPELGRLLNLVAFVTDDDKEWPSSKFTISATRQDALRDFATGGFSPTVLALLNKTKAKMDRWGLFDLADNPLSSFFLGRAMVIGDAAHASTPHHGSGAGFCMEDIAVFASLLEELLTSPEFSGQDLGNVFRVFDASRRERDLWLVQSSRRAADLYEWRLPDLGKQDFEKMREDIEGRQDCCWGYDLDRATRDARQRLLSTSTGRTNPES